MHKGPEVVNYSGKELLDLMGPVETQYCDVQMQPVPVVELDPAALVVDFSQVPGFDEVVFEITDDQGGREAGARVPRSAGREEGAIWTLDRAFDTDTNTGDYTVEVWLVDDGVMKEPCSSSFRIVAY